MSVQAQEKLYTIGDIETLPEEKRVELIDGVIYDMAAPSIIHQVYVGSLYKMISNYIDSRDGKCRSFIAPVAVYLNQDDYNYVEPDVLVVCDQGKISERGCEGAPDLVIEVASPGSQRMDYYIKLFKYRSSGVREYWIVDPKKNSVIVYDFIKEMTETYTLLDSVPVGIFGGDFEINFSKIE